MWPTPSPVECFVERRRRFLSRCDFPAAFGSGIARVRNFEGNRFPFRAESHFLYLVGQHVEEALLCFDEGRAVLYLEPPDGEDALWHGTEPTLEERADALQLEVRPLSEFEAPEEVATLPPSDVESALWLEALLDRPVEAGNLEAVEHDVVLAELMIGQRLRHDQHAIEQMRYAAQVTALAHHAGMSRTRPGQREAVVRAAVEEQMAAAGLSPAYNSIVTTQGQVLHHERSVNVMHAGDLMLVDAGAESVEGWASDVTRTWPVSGRFTGVQASVYDLVLRCQLAAIEMCRPGVRFLDVHRRASRVMVEGLVELKVLSGDVDGLLERGAAALFFPHGIGHLLGLDVHDMEDLGDLAGYAKGRSRSSAPAERYLRLDRDLEPGMVVTIEPGFYRIEQQLSGPAFDAVADAIDQEALARLNGIAGIRIEDDVLITEDGHDVLSSAVVKARADVEAAVGG